VYIGAAAGAREPSNSEGDLEKATVEVASGGSGGVNSTGSIVVTWTCKCEGEGDGHTLVDSARCIGNQRQCMMHGQSATVHDAWPISDSA
jgi:hypothetical protein